jgi:hypothetical protein
MQTEEIIPQTHTVTSNTEQPSAPITEQDIEASKIYDWLYSLSTDNV